MMRTAHAPAPRCQVYDAGCRELPLLNTGECGQRASFTSNPSSRSRPSKHKVIRCPLDSIRSCACVYVCAFVLLYVCVCEKKEESVHAGGIHGPPSRVTPSTSHQCGEGVQRHLRTSPTSLHSRESCVLDSQHVAALRATEADIRNKNPI